MVVTVVAGQSGATAARDVERDEGLLLQGEPESTDLGGGIDRDEALSQVHRPSGSGAAKLFGEAEDARTGVRTHGEAQTAATLNRIRQTPEFKKLEAKIGEEAANTFLTELIDAGCTSSNSLTDLITIANDSGHTKSTCRYLPKMWSAGITNSQVINVYCRIACDIEYDPDKRFEAIIQADQELRDNGVTDPAHRVWIIEASTYSGDTHLSTKLKDLPETTKNLMDQGWNVIEITELLQSVCSEDAAGKDGGWVVGRLDEAVSKLTEDGHNKFWIKYLLKGDWKKYVDTGIERRPIDGKGTWWENAKDAVSQTRLADADFYSKYVSPDHHGEYTQVVSKLRERGFSDSEIEKMIVQAYKNVPTARGYSNRKDQAIDSMLEKIEVLDELGLSEELSFADYFEIMTEHIITGRLRRGAEAFSAMVHSQEERKKYLEWLSPMELVSLIGMIGNSCDRDGTCPYDISAINLLCLRAKLDKGITHWSRYSAVSLDNVLNPKPGGKTVFVIAAKDDHNGAFENTYRDLELLIEQGYNVVLIETDDEDEIYRALDAMPKGSIDMMLVYGHGSPNGTALSNGSPDERSRIDLDDKEWASYRNRFSGNAEVFLFSCSTGKGGEGAENMGSRFNEWLGLTTYAPNRDSAGGLYKDESGKIAVSYVRKSDLEIFDDYSKK